MKKENKKNIFPKINKGIYWTPRILSILFVLFLALFSLDVFDKSNNYTFGETILALFMHNIPALILLIILVISWKYEIVGGIAFILAGLLYVLLIIMNILREPSNLYMTFWALQISGPAFLIGVLFLINWHKKRKKR
jgi:hypothetical protein